jgi:hypothetical protein
MRGLWLGKVTVNLTQNTKKPANLFAPKFQRKRLRIKRLAGFFAFIRSNLCTRHIQKKLTPRGHHDWPDKHSIDPFGDFDLIFRAAKYNLKLIDLPVRYRERTYGETNIQHWTNGWLLLRMVALALRRIKFV